MLRPTTAARDIRGRYVRLGAKVRVLKISPWVLARVNAADKGCLRSMVGHIFEVGDIDEWGHPWVLKSCRGCGTHGIALAAGEMELVLPQRGRRRRVNSATIAKRH